MVVATLVGLTLSDVALRMLRYQPTMIDSAMFVAKPDTLLPYGLRAGYRGSYGGGLVSIDAEGSRVVHSFPPSSKDVAGRVVLLIGDSQIFGQGLNDDQTIPSQLQDSLLARSLNVSVRNIGVPGYTSWNEYRALENYLATHHVDDVIFLYYPNDATFDNDYFGFGRAQRSHLPASSVAHSFARWIYGRVYTIAFLRQQWLERKHPAPTILDVTDSAIAYSMAALTNASELCRKANVRMAVGLYRDVDALTAPQAWYDFENRVAYAMTATRLHWFVVSSHTSRLSRRQIMVSMMDKHASSRASALIVSDFLRELRP